MSEILRFRPTKATQTFPLPSYCRQRSTELLTPRVKAAPLPSVAASQGRSQIPSVPSVRRWHLASEAGKGGKQREPTHGNSRGSRAARAVENKGRQQWASERFSVLRADDPSPSASSHSVSRGRTALSPLSLSGGARSCRSGVHCAAGLANGTRGATYPEGRRRRRSFPLVAARITSTLFSKPGACRRQDGGAAHLQQAAKNPRRQHPHTLPEAGTWPHRGPPVLSPQPPPLPCPRCHGGVGPERDTPTRRACGTRSVLWGWQEKLGCLSLQPLPTGSLFIFPYWT